MGLTIPSKETVLKTAGDTAQVFATGYLASRIITWVNPFKGGFVLGLHHVIHQTGEFIINKQCSNTKTNTRKKILKAWTFVSIPTTLAAAALLGSPVSVLEFAASNLAYLGLTLTAVKICEFAQNCFGKIHYPLKDQLNYLEFFSDFYNVQSVRELLKDFASRMQPYRAEEYSPTNMDFVSSTQPYRAEEYSLSDSDSGEESESSSAKGVVLDS